MTNHFHTHRLAWGLLMGLAACSSNRVINISATERATAQLVPLNAPDSGGEDLGELPKTIEVDKVSGHSIRLAAVGKSPQYWIVPNDLANQTDVRIQFSQPIQEKAPAENFNLPFRLLMKSYQALASKEFKLCRDIAGQLAAINPAVSAPHILMGISYLQEGKKSEALAAFTKAKALDPEDGDILELVKAAK